MTNKKSFVAASLLAAAIGLSAIYAATPTTVEEASAASEVVTLKLDASTWGSASAYYTIHYWGGSTATSWPGAKFNSGKAASGSAEITATWDNTSTHCIIIRWGNSACTTEWNRWDYYDGNTMTAGSYNYFTNTGWSNCNGSKKVVEENCTVTFYNKAGTVAKTETVNKGFELEGWYKEQSLTNKIEKGEAITTNLTLYPKYVEVEDYVIWVRDVAGGFGKDVNLYMWCDAYDGHTNQAWPGIALKEVSTDLYMIEVDASKCYDRFIINDTTHQTVDISFSSTGHDFYAISNSKVDDKNTCSSLYHNASTLSAYVLSDDTEGTCQNKFEGAKLLYLDLSEEEQTAFKTDATYADAHARYVAWATALGLDPYTGTSATRSYFFTSDNTSNVAVILVIVTCLSFVGLIAVKSVRKARKED